MFYVTSCHTSMSSYSYVEDYYYPYIEDEETEV